LLILNFLQKYNLSFQEIDSNVIIQLIKLKDVGNDFTALPGGCEKQKTETSI